MDSSQPTGNNMARKEIIQNEWDCEFGKIQVGDRVVVITEEYSHRISMRVGKYLGYIESEGWRGEKVRKVKVEVESTRHQYFIKGTNKLCSWTNPEAEFRKVKYTFTTTLQRNRIVPLPKGNAEFAETLNKQLRGK